MTQIRFYYADGRIAGEEPYEPAEFCSGQRTGEIGALCGGCTGCLLQQADHAGARYDLLDDLHDHVRGLVRRHLWRNVVAALAAATATEAQACPYPDLAANLLRASHDLYRVNLRDPAHPTPEPP